MDQQPPVILISASCMHYWRYGKLDFCISRKESQSIWARICSITASYISTRRRERPTGEQRNARTLQTVEDSIRCGCDQLFSKY